MYRIAIIGGGPGGLSAAGRCAERGIEHIVLERSAAIADTIQKYQRGKHVMAEPDNLPLRSSLGFDIGKREDVLDVWEKAVFELGINIRYEAEVRNIDGKKGGFTIELDDGDKLEAEYVILAIGVQGNPRKLAIPGADVDFVQYQLDDPEEFQGETIAVVGAGDAAIENALGLARRNRVFIINRKDEFARAKEGNLNQVLEAIDNGNIECFYESEPSGIESLDASDDFAGNLVLDTAEGNAEVSVSRIIARIGSIPPRGLVESFGIEFPNDRPDAIPELTSKYESNVAGMYVIGALGGYPLIKQAMNQGYEVVETIEGNDVKPADHNLFEEKFENLPWKMEVDEVLDLMQERIPVFSGVNALQFRELMLESRVWVPDEGDIIFSKNDYTNTFFTILDGNVKIEVDDDVIITSDTGSFFGEMSLISGRRRSATVRAGADCVLVETPRRAMRKLVASVDAVRKVLDETFIVRSIQQNFAPGMPIEDLQPIAESARLRQYAPHEVIFEEGDEADSLHFIRSGSVTISKDIDGRNVVMSYVPANRTIGEMGLLGETKRTATVRATVKTETISLDKDSFEQLLEKSPGLKEELEELMAERHQQNVAIEHSGESGALLSFLMEEGLGEATDVLLIDETLCISCDLCEIACAGTHRGATRLNRKAGPTFAHIHVPISCRHCEDPHCMKNCPPDAIHRGGVDGEVYIDDSCIGCGNCAENCPYDVIQMGNVTGEADSFWRWMFFGLGKEPGRGKALAEHNPGEDIKKAVKCDMCMGIEGGPACVRACPTGAAMRISPEDFVDLVKDASD